jgi:hypothetical protein
MNFCGMSVFEVPRSSSLSSEKGKERAVEGEQEETDAVSDGEPEGLVAVVSLTKDEYVRFDPLPSPPLPLAL